MYVVLYIVSFLIFGYNGQKINFTTPKDVYENIFIYYFQGPTIDNHIILKLEDGLSLPDQENFDVSSTTIFYFHGWGGAENPLNGSSRIVVSALLEKKIRNIVSFDYTELVKNENYFTYLFSSLNVSIIGETFGEFFKAYIPLKQSNNLVRLISHSLGSQVMSKTARAYGKGQLAHLTGLDPAGPFFNLPFVSHLDERDAIFVDIIHTDGYLFGYGNSIGTVDFFPNSGVRIQPGCNDDLFNFFTFCSHVKSYHYYAESIINPKAFPAKKCERILLSGHCCCNDSDIIYMGYYVDTRAKGNYFLNTNSKPPYSEGIKGIDEYN